jgi:hypothetical protein
MGRYRPNLFGSGWGPMAAFCEHDNDPLGSLKCWEFLEWLIKKIGSMQLDVFFLLSIIVKIILFYIKYFSALPQLGPPPSKKAAHSIIQHESMQD